MTSSATKRPLLLIGLGDIFEEIHADPDAFGLSAATMETFQFKQVDDLASTADDILGQYEPEKIDIFVAVDSNDLNFARLELYGRAKLRGFTMQRMIHRGALISAPSNIGENVFVGAGSIVSANCRVSANSFIGHGVRLGQRVSIGAHTWIATGVSVDADTQIEAHCVVGFGTTLRAGSHIQKYVLLDQSGSHSGTWMSGTFLEDGYAAPIQMIGSGFSYKRGED